MPRTVRIRTASSEWWAVVGRPSPTTVRVQMAKADGSPDKRFAQFDACAICFAGDPEAEDERQRRPGFCAPPIAMGRCPWCGFVHDAKVTKHADSVTSEATEVSALKAAAREATPELP